MYGKIKNKLPNLKVSLHTYYNNYAYIFMLLLVFGLESWHGESGQMASKRKGNDGIMR